MQRNDLNNEVKKNESNSHQNSTKKIVGSLGGPPKNPLQLGKKVRVYDSSEEIKIDEDGSPYIGIRIRELIEQENKKDIIDQVSMTGEDSYTFTLSPKDDEEYQGHNHATVLSRSYRPDSLPILTEEEKRDFVEHSHSIRTDVENLRFDPVRQMCFFPPAAEEHKTAANRHDFDFTKYEEIVVEYVETGTIAPGLTKEDLLNKLSILNQAEKESLIDSIETKRLICGNYPYIELWVKNITNEIKWIGLAGVTAGVAQYQSSKDLSSAAAAGVASAIAVFYLKLFYDDYQMRNKLDGIRQRADELLQYLSRKSLHEPNIKQSI